MKNPFKRFWKYYIKGEDHCDTCPCFRSEHSAWTEEWDEGCVIKGECTDDGCRLIPPFRTILCWIRTKQLDYAFEHEYDDYPAYAEKQDRELEGIKDSIKRHILDDANLYYWNCLSGKFQPLDDKHTNSLLRDAWEIRNEYEDIAHPFVRKSLQQEWRELLSKTVDRLLVQPIAPFIPRQRK